MLNFKMVLPLDSLVNTIPISSFAFILSPFFTKIEDKFELEFIRFHEKKEQT